jgi:hypothetical protein
MTSEELAVKYLVKTLMLDIVTMPTILGDGRLPYTDTYLFVIRFW